MNWEKICDRVIEYAFYALFFLIPLVMTPWNFELFEYNKMMLTYVLTIIITASWLVKMVRQRRILFKRTPLDIPLVIFLASQLLSTLFSIDRHTSLWGYYSRFHGGLLSTLSYLLLYWAFVSNFDKRKTLCSLFSVLCSATLVAIYGILEHFGIDAKYWVQDVQNRVFSTLGQPNWLAGWLAALLPIPLAFAINIIISLKQQPKLKIQKLITNYQFLISISLFTIFSLCLFFTKSRSGLPAAVLALGLFIFIILAQKLITFKKQLLLPIILIFIIGVIGASYLGLKTLFTHPRQDLAYIFGITNQTSVPVQNASLGGSESGDIRKIVWRGTIDIAKHYPLFGSGVETFAYSYYNFRPALHNLLSEWDFLYNKAHNEYLNLFATTGTFGLLSYLLLIGWFIYWSTKEIRNKKYEIGKEDIAYRLLLIAFLAGYVSILITNFLGFSVVPVALLFFLFPGFAVVLTQTEQSAQRIVHKKENSVQYRQYTALVFILLAISYLLLTICRMWYADVLYARGSRELKQGYAQQAFTDLQHASQFNPHEPVIRSELGYAASLLATLAQKEKKTDLTNQLVTLSLKESTLALSASPKNLNFWKNQVKVYYVLSELDPQFLQPALETLLRAIDLAPTDAKLWYNLGVLYTKIGQTEKAIQALEKTVELKENYQEDRYALALLYDQTGQKEKAAEQLAYILSKINWNLPEVHELYQKVTGRNYSLPE
jgi:O-antigen ligase